MKKREKEPKGPIEVPQSTWFDSGMLAQFAMKVRGTGFVPTAELLAEFGENSTSQALAILYRTWRLFREVNRPWNGGEARGYEWADRRFSHTEAKKVPAELGFILELSRGAGQTYADWKEINLRCCWTNLVLGPIPSKDVEGELNIFEWVGEEIVIPAYCLRSMAQIVLPMVGKSTGVAFHIGWSAVRVKPDKEVGVHRSGIIRKEGGKAEGAGIRRNECIYPPQEFVIEAMVPTSAIPAATYIEMIRKAGKWARFSPARSAGYGDFTLLGEA